MNKLRINNIYSRILQYLPRPRYAPHSVYVPFTLNKDIQIRYKGQRYGACIFHSFSMKLSGDRRNLYDKLNSKLGYKIDYDFNDILLNSGRTHVYTVIASLDIWFSVVIDFSEKNT